MIQRYPTTEGYTDTMRHQLAVDAFLMGMRDLQAAQTVATLRPGTLDTALFEAKRALQDMRVLGGRTRVRHVQFDCSRTPSPGSRWAERKEEDKGEGAKPKPDDKRMDRMEAMLELLTKSIVEANTRQNSNSSSYSKESRPRYRSPSPPAQRSSAQRQRHPTTDFVAGRC